MHQENIRQKLALLMPRLARFSAVLAGDPHRFNLFELGFLEYFENWLEKQIADEISLADFSAQVFAGVYSFWLLHIEQGKIKPVILKYKDSIIQPGVFADAQDDMARQTGAFLVGLAPQQRAALVLIVAEGFSYQQAAQILRVDRDVISSQVALARAALAGGRYTAPKGVLNKSSCRTEKLEHADTRLVGT